MKSLLAWLSRMWRKPGASEYWQVLHTCDGKEYVLDVGRQEKIDVQIQADDRR